MEGIVAERLNAVPQGVKAVLLAVLLAAGIVLCAQRRAADPLLGHLVITGAMLVAGFIPFLFAGARHDL